jgi:Tfp pilus assembly protein PilF
MLMASTVYAQSGFSYFSEEYLPGLEAAKKAFEMFESGNFSGALKQMTIAAKILDKDYFIERAEIQHDLEYENHFKGTVGYTETDIANLTARAQAYAVYELCSVKRLTQAEVEKAIRKYRGFMNSSEYKSALHYFEVYAKILELEQTMAEKKSDGIDEQLDKLIKENIEGRRPGEIFPLFRASRILAVLTGRHEDKMRARSLVDLGLSKFPENVILKKIVAAISDWPQNTMENRSLDKNLAIAKDFISKRNYEKAFLFLRDCYARSPENTQIGLMFAQVSIEVGKRDDAAKIARQIMEREPNNKEALILFQDATESWESQLRAAYELLQKKNYKKATIRFKKVYAEKPDVLEVVYGLTLSYAKAGYTKQAKRYLDEAMKLSPGNEKLLQLKDVLNN